MVGSAMQILAGNATLTDCAFAHNYGTSKGGALFIGEKMAVGVIDARIYENYEIPPLLTLTDISFTDCEAPAEILTRKQNHNERGKHQRRHRHLGQQRRFYSRHPFR